MFWALLCITNLNEVRVLDSVEAGGVALRLDLVREEREAETRSVELQRGVVTALHSLQVRVAAVAAVVRLLAEVDLEASLPALLSAGLTTSLTRVEHSQQGGVEGLGPVVAAACAQLER